MQLRGNHLAASQLMAVFLLYSRRFSRYATMQLMSKAASDEPLVLRSAVAEYTESEELIEINSFRSLN